MTQAAAIQKIRDALVSGNYSDAEKVLDEYFEERTHEEFDKRVADFGKKMAEAKVGYFGLRRKEVVTGADSFCVGVGHEQLKNASTGEQNILVLPWPGIL